MNRNKLITKINIAMPEANASMSEEFNGETGCIWFRGSEEITASGTPVFDMYYHSETLGVNPILEEILSDAGWYGEAHDAGTLLAYQFLADQ